MIHWRSCMAQTNALRNAKWPAHPNVDVRNWGGESFLRQLDGAVQALRKAMDWRMVFDSVVLTENPDAQTRRNGTDRLCGFWGDS